MGILGNLVADLLRGIGGPLGRRLRGIFYRSRLGSCGMNVMIDAGVHIIGPGYVHLGDHVWLDKNCILIGGRVTIDGKPAGEPPESQVPLGEIRIGKYSHVGIGTVIQGHGGVVTGDYFTTSAHCRIYSLSNDYRRCRSGTIEGEHEVFYSSAPVVIGRNVWLGLGVSVISTEIGDDVFAMPHSVVSRRIPANSVVAGSPASRIRERFDDVRPIEKS